MRVSQKLCLFLVTVCLRFYMTNFQVYDKTKTQHGQNVNNHIFAIYDIHMYGIM